MRAEMGKDPSRAPPSQLNLPPGFRFYPTDEELVVHYLCKKAASEPFSVPIIAEVELYKFDPWDLPERALFGEKEWYFFSPRDRKYPNGSRPNRAAGAGYWKATGTDKPISTMGGSKKVGVKKALVFYKGKAPKGVKTNWIMHEYRLADSGARSAKKKGTLRLDDWVLCRIYKKCSGAQKLPNVKERSESSCLDTVLSPTQVSDGNLDSFPQGAYVEKGMASGHGMYKGGHASAIDMRSYKDGHASTIDMRSYKDEHASTIDMSSYPMRNLPELNLYMQQLQSRGFEVMTENAVQKYGIVKNEQQGTSSLEMSNPESHVYSSRQTSSPEGSGQEDDAVESTFNLFRTSFPTEQLNTFTQSLYGMDAGLLPSPTIQGQSSFASLLDSDYSSIFPTADYNLQMRPFSRGSHWDAKGNFSTM